MGDFLVGGQLGKEAVVRVPFPSSRVPTLWHYSGPGKGFTGPGWAVCCGRPLRFGSQLWAIATLAERDDEHGYLRVKIDGENEGLAPILGNLFIGEPPERYSVRPCRSPLSL